MAETTATTLAAVEFHGATLVTTLVDGVPHVALRPLCDAIGIDWQGQHKRLSSHPILSSVVSVTETTGGDGKTYKMTCLPLKHLNGWLFGVDANRVDPAVRERLLEYQRECYDALADYWQKGAATNPRGGASALVGQSTGMPTAQLIALQTHAWKLVDRLKAETAGELRQDLYQQIEKVYADMGMPPPPLAAIGWEAPEVSADVAQFFGVVQALERLGHPVNHSRNPEMIAVKLPQVNAFALKEGLDMPPLGMAFKRQLRACKAPRFVDCKSVSSTLTGGTEHCWVFVVQKGGAA